MYRTLPKAVERADFFRYLVILRHGGMYADSDVECMMPIEDWKDVRAPFPCFLVSFFLFPRLSQVAVAPSPSGSPSLLSGACCASTGTSPFGFAPEPRRARGV